MAIVARLKPWTPVSVDINQEIPKIWYDSTIHCYITDKDCSTCAIYRHYGYINSELASRQCKMPQSVQIMLDRGDVVSKVKINGFKKNTADVLKIGVVYAD